MWQKYWLGPSDFDSYLHSVVSRAKAVQNWNQKGLAVLKNSIALSELFNPDIFISALKHQTAR